MTVSNSVLGEPQARYQPPGPMPDGSLPLYGSSPPPGTPGGGQPRPTITPSDGPARPSPEQPTDAPSPVAAAALASNTHVVIAPPYFKTGLQGSVGCREPHVPLNSQAARRTYYTNLAARRPPAPVQRGGPGGGARPEPLGRAAGVLPERRLHGPNKASYGITAIYRRYVEARTGDENDRGGPRDHGRRASHQYWAARGCKSLNTASRNTFTASASKVS